MEQKILLDLREHILREMELKNWNLTETAIQCNMPYRQFQAILYGERKDVKLSTIVKICKALDLHIFIADTKSNVCIQKIDKISEKHKQSICDYIDYIYDTKKA